MSRPGVGREGAGRSLDGAPCPREPAARRWRRSCCERTVRARRWQEHPAAFSYRSFAAPKASGASLLRGATAGDGNIGPHPTPYSLAQLNRGTNNILRFILYRIPYLAAGKYNGAVELQQNLCPFLGVIR